MDKKVIFAVAGSGKTTHIINSLSLDRRSLVITYTENNCHHLNRKVIEKFGHIPKNITIQTYYTFLYSFCYKPFLHYIWDSKGINWDTPPQFTLRLKRTDRKFYIDKNKRLYSNRIAKLVADNAASDIMSRLEKYYDDFLVDEVQDFAGHDFNLLKKICKSKIDVLLVGDFFQHTFDTSRDGAINKSLYDDFNKYKKHFLDIGLKVDTKSLSHSFRCSPSICTFVRENLGINIESFKNDEYEIHYLNGEKTITEIFYDDNIVKLFFKEHHKYPCHSNNWGKSKGLDNYKDVCIALYPKALQGFIDSDFSQLPASSRNKLYVACTRSNRALYFIDEKELKSFKSR
ncbi:AAA family ATPase [Marinobacterium sedimentorum]|uniref:AAA family ATPase n=1 Tax=Marinobacterium sedimentorum TaxID=2927804 RepID=UPI0020C5DCBB|nr:AAA family ATPase [Marinobacterium sedimentorum]MCP8685937.1 TGBp1 family protein [Marinobacterium sedimentorum]